MNKARSSSRLATAIVLVATFSSVNGVAAATGVYYGEGMMRGYMCEWPGQPACPDWTEFTYSGPVRVELSDNGPVESDAPFCIVGSPHYTYTVRSVDPVQYTNSDGSIGFGYAEITMTDPYPANACWGYTQGSVDPTAGAMPEFASGSGFHAEVTNNAGHLTGSDGGSASYSHAFSFDVAISPAPLPTIGTSWDGISLQEILDAEYGPGAIDVATGFEGYLVGDGDPAWWQDLGITSILIREIAGFENANTMGWYVENLMGAPSIDGIGDGVIFTGPTAEGAEVIVSFATNTRFGLYLNPNGIGSSYNAPEPEHFFTNRFYNDIGPDGSGALHAPTDGDIQCLIFNITHLRNGVPTYVVAWEDLDSGAPVLPQWSTSGTDNDYNDLVVEISAFSPVEVEVESWGGVKGRYEE